MDRRLVAKSRLVVVCLFLLGVSLLSGCSSPASTTGSDSSTQAGVLGPYPAGLTVTLNGVSFSLESVEVVDRPSYADSSAVLAPGRRKVNATFVFRGPGTNPAPGGGFFYPDIALIADGKDVSVDGSGVANGYDLEAPAGVAPRDTLSFEVPADVQSAVIRLVPSFADTQTVAFRLW